MELLNEDYADLVSHRQLNPKSAAMHLMERLERASQRRHELPERLVVAPALRPERGEHDLPGRPADVRALSLKKLAATTVGDPIQALNGKNHLGKILQQEIVAVEFRLDAFKHVHCMTFIPRG